MLLIFMKNTDLLIKTHKNQLPDGCLRIDIEAKTQDGAKHGYCGKYSLRYSDLAKIEFRALDKYR